jgi:hypothetical protein
MKRHLNGQYGAVLYVARAGTDVGPMLAKPCKACLHVLAAAR